MSYGVNPNVHHVHHYHHRRSGLHNSIITPGINDYIVGHGAYNRSTEDLKAMRGGYDDPSPPYTTTPMISSGSLNNIHSHGIGNISRHDLKIMKKLHKHQKKQFKLEKKLY